MNYYKLYMEMMARGEYDKLERDGQGNMKDRRALLQQGVLDQPVNVDEDNIVPDFLIKILNYKAVFRNYFKENNKKNYSFKELLTLVEGKFKVLTDKITPNKKDRFLVLPKTGQIILCNDNDGVHADLVNYAMMLKLIPVEEQYAEWNYSENDFIKNLIVAFQVDNRNVVYMSESYDNGIVDHIQNDFIIIKKCEAIIEKYLNVTSIVFSGYSRFEW